MVWSQSVFYDDTDRAFGHYKGMYKMHLGYLTENNISNTEYFEMAERTFNIRQMEVREQSTLYRLFENARTVILTNEGVLINGDAFQVIVQNESRTITYMFLACQFNNRLYYRVYQIGNE
jgi:hypothetical protein